MKSSRLFGELAIVVIICVIGILLLPASAGPYSAVHGPVTALRAVRTAIKVRWAMMIAALAMSHFAVRFKRGSMPAAASSALLLLYSPGYTSILRC